ncbi:MAG: PAS domain S-box protein [Rhodocyclaceae bacterium]|nr:PAS domain S-box protein [Rhodocyclaceae bacterium]
MPDNLRAGAGGAGYRLFLLAIATTVAMVAYLAIADYQEVEANAKATQGAALKLAATNLRTTLDTADVMLGSVVQSVSPRIDQPRDLATFWADAAPRLQRYLERFPAVQGVAIWDAEGQFILGTAPPATGYTTDAATVKYFRRLVEDAKGTLAISQAIPSPYTKQPVLILVRPIIDSRGRNRGAVTAPLDLSYLESLLAEMPLGSDGMAELRRTDNSQLVAVFPPVPAQLNQPLPKHPAHLRILAGASSGSVDFLEESGTTPTQLVSFQRLEGFPLYLQLSQPRRAIQADWRTRTVNVGLLAGLALIAIFLAYHRLARAHRQLGEQEAFLRTLYDTADVAVFMLTIPGNRIAYPNQRMSELFHVSADTLVGLDYRDLVTEEARADALRSFSRLTAGTIDTVDLERHFKRPDGTTFWGHVTSRLLTDRTGRTTGLVAVVADITAHREAQQGLERTNRLLRDVLAAATPIAIIATDPKGQITLFNRGAELLLGYRSEDMVGRTQATDLADPEELRQAREDLGMEYGYPADDLAVLTSEAEWRGLARQQWTLIRQDGKSVPVSTTVTPIGTEPGKPQGFLIICQDISERLRTRDELKRYRDHLENLVATRTRQIEQLNTALETRALEAEAANRAKSTFLANMSHELRTPMNAILGLTHILRKEAGTASQIDRLCKISDAAGHLLQILNDILDFSKIEAGKLNLERMAFDLEGVIRNACALLAHRAQARNMEFVVDLDISLATGNPLVGDPTRIGQSLLNYLSNAVKFAEEGEVLIRAQVDGEQGDELLIRLTVTDQGPGIAPEAQARLFGAFEQADSSTARRFGGTGLGLAITRRLAQLMGGQAGVDSVVGQGSSFWLTLRLRRGAPARVAPSLAGQHVLVVEPRPLARACQAQLFRLLGARVDTAESPSAARALAPTAPFTLLCLGWPQAGDGDGGLATLLQDVAPGALGLLACGPDQADLPLPARLAGFQGPLAKPVTPGSLLVLLERLLPGLGGAATAEAPSANASPDQRLLGEFRGARILLAEDSPINQEVARQLLADVGLTVDTANDGREAASLAARTEYDLILMDMQMPEMDGPEATRAIRALPGRAAVPIIALTANAFADDRQACLDAGMNDHVAKPVNPHILYATLLQWLQRPPA